MTASARVLLLLLGLAGTVACSDGGAAGRTPAGEVADAHDRPADEEVSDLDRPLAELMAVRCEHELPAHACAECRYEVGVVRADEALFDPGRGGVLTSIEVRRGPSPQVREVPGEVVFDANRTVAVSPRSEGVVEAVRVDLGARVRAGEVVLELECPAYREAAAELTGRLADEHAAAAAVTREEELHRRKICPEKDVLEARARLAAVRAARRAAEARLIALGMAEGDLERLRVGEDAGLLPVRAPLSGEVVERAANRGARVSPGDELLVIADTAQMWVMAQLREPDIGVVHGAGPAPAEVEVAAWPSRTFSGRIEQIAGRLDPTTRTARARIVVDNPDGLLRAGMFARVRLILGSGEPAIMVPREAVLEDEGRHFAFVHVDGPYWGRRPVRTGATVGDRLEIVAGLAEGDRIVTTGAFLLKSDVLRAKMGAGCAD